MIQVKLTPQSQIDLENTFEYSFEYSDASALRLAEGFDEVLNRLVEYPESCHPRPELGDSIRVSIMRQFNLNIFYKFKIGSSELLVVRILRHEHKDTV